MRLSATCSALLPAMLISNVCAAEDPDPQLDRFHAFAAPFLDGEWDYHNRMTGPGGEVTYEGDDLRTYTLGIRNRFLIETVYSEDDDGTRVHTGLTLIGVDLETGRVSISPYWSWQATAIGVIEAEIRELQDGRLGLIGKGGPPGLDFPVVELECGFVSDSAYRCETHMTIADGRRFKSSDETFVRRN